MTAAASNDSGRPRRRAARLVAAGWLASLLAVAPSAAVAVGVCKPLRPLPAIVLKDMGPCAFDAASLRFAGEPAEQAACLLRATNLAQLGPRVENIPHALAHRIGRSAGLPDHEALAAFLVELDLAWDFAAFLWQPVSRARNNDPAAPPARYFVIHDTSGPNFGGRPWPSDLDDNPRINSLARFRCADNCDLDAFAHSLDTLTDRLREPAEAAALALSPPGRARPEVAPTE